MMWLQFKSGSFLGRGVWDHAINADWGMLWLGNEDSFPSPQTMLHIQFDEQTFLESKGTTYSHEVLSSLILILHLCMDII